MNKVLVSAEPGCTHEGRLENMLALIRMAADCGADAYKSQWVSSPGRLCERRRAPEYLDSYRLIAYPVEWHLTLRKECDAEGLLYGCSCYLPEDVAAVAPFADFHKVASFEAGDRAFLEAHRAIGKPVWASAGMMDEKQALELAVWLWRNRQNPKDTILHCVSAYPCPVEQARLASIGRLWETGLRMMGLRVGFSDHTGSAFTGALAVAAGARALEIHVRLDDADPTNPDYPHALTPRKFRQYVTNVRIAEAAMGDGEKRVMPAEEKMMRYRVHG